MWIIFIKNISKISKCWSANKMDQGLSFYNYYYYALFCKCWKKLENLITRKLCIHRWIMNSVYIILLLVLSFFCAILFNYFSFRRSRSPSDQNRYTNSNNHRHHRRSRSNGRSYSRSRSRSRTSPPPPLPSSPKYRRKNNRYSYGSRSPRSRSRYFFYKSDFFSNYIHKIFKF